MSRFQKSSTPTSHTFRISLENSPFLLVAELAMADAKVKEDVFVLRTAIGNYHRFTAAYFRLFAQTPDMGCLLMDMFVVRGRLNAMYYICKS